MQRITWELPFKELQYLESLTEQLAKVPAIILITGMQDFNGAVHSCNITLREDATPEQILYLGAVIGAHSVEYAAQVEAAKARVQDLMGIVQNLVDQYVEEELITDEVIYLPEIAGSFLEKEAEEEVEEAVGHVTTFIEEEVAEKGVETSDDDIEDAVIVEEEEETETAQEEEQEEVETVIEEEAAPAVDVEDVITEIIEIKKKPDSRARLMLRKILNNFKKS